jgi:hypothetical protein
MCTATAMATRDDADRGPHIGHEVVPVGFERDAVQALADRDEHQRHPEIDGGGDQGKRNAEAGSVDRVRRGESRRCGKRDAHRREDDQRAFGAACKIFRLEAAVGMPRIRRSGREPQHRQGEQRCGQVDERLERVREQTDRIRDIPGERLQDDGHDRRGERQPGVALKRAIRGHPPMISPSS